MLNYVTDFLLVSMHLVSIVLGSEIQANITNHWHSLCLLFFEGCRDVDDSMNDSTSIYSSGLSPLIYQCSPPWILKVRFHFCSWLIHSHCAQIRLWNKAKAAPSRNAAQMMRGHKVIIFPSHRKQM